MEHAELEALVDLGLAASTLDSLAEAAILHEQLKIAEAMLLVARTVRAQVATLRPMVCAIGRRRAGMVVHLHTFPMGGDEA